MDQKIFQEMVLTGKENKTKILIIKKPANYSAGFLYFNYV